MTKTLPISEARQELPTLVEETSRTMGRVIITRKGKPEAVLMGHDEFESWAETLDVLADPEELEAIRQGVADLRAGNFVSFAEAFGEPLGADRRAGSRQAAGATLEKASPKSAKERGHSKDDTIKIHGIGPVIERVLNRLGTHAFLQVASWEHTDIRRVAAKLASSGFSRRDAEPVMRLAMMDSEVQALRRLACGRSIKQIARELNLSVKTVMAIKSGMQRKIGQKPERHAKAPAKRRTLQVSY